MSAAARRAAAGFTLIEVLIGLAILGITSALLVSSVFTLVKGANDGVIRLDRLDSDRLIVSFLRRTIESARPVALPRDNRNEIVFKGGRSELQFVGHLPSHRGGGGLTLISLSQQPATTGSNLVLATHDGWETSGDEPAESRQSLVSRELVRDVEELTFSYYGDADSSSRPRWSDEWSDSDRLPDLIRLELRVSGRTWPAMIIAVRNRDTRNQPHLLITSAAGRA